MRGSARAPDPPRATPPPPPSHVPADSVMRVGKYVLLDTLGEGAFGKVKLAINETTGREYAIKIMAKSHIMAHELTLQVRREIAVMKALRHPNIVCLHEVLNSSKNLYMVMDLVTGGELFDVVADQKRLPEAQARAYFQQLVDGVEYCHSRRVYHRDLKPENILVSEDKRQLKITDFGLASIKEQNASSELLWTVMGSPHYIPPEIITSAAKGYEGEKVDVWASGMVLFGMLAGFLPFDHPETNKLYRAIVHSPVEFPSHFSYDVVKLLSAIFQKNPTNRPNMTQIKSFAWFKVDYCPAVLRSPRAPEEKMGKKRSKKKKGDVHRRHRETIGPEDPISVESNATPDSPVGSSATVLTAETLGAVSPPTAQNVVEEAPKNLAASSSRPRRILGRLGHKSQKSESTAAAGRGPTINEAVAHDVLDDDNSKSWPSKDRMTSKADHRIDMHHFPTRPAVSSSDSVVASAAEDAPAVAADGPAKRVLRDKSLVPRPSYDSGRRSAFSSRKGILASYGDHKKEKSGHTLGLSNVLGQFRKKSSQQPPTPHSSNENPLALTLPSDSSPPVSYSKRAEADIGDVSDVSPLRSDELHLFSKVSEDNTSSRSMKILANAYRKSVGGMKARGMSVKSLSMRMPKGSNLSDELPNVNQWDPLKRRNTPNVLDVTDFSYSQPTSPISPKSAESVAFSPASLFSHAKQSDKANLTPQSLPSEAFFSCRDGFEPKSNLVSPAGSEQHGITQNFSTDNASATLFDTPRALRDMTIGEYGESNNDATSAQSALTTHQDDVARLRSAQLDSNLEPRMRSVCSKTASSCAIFKPTRLLINEDDGSSQQYAEAPHVLCPPRFVEGNEYLKWCLDSTEVFADVEDEAPPKKVAVKNEQPKLAGVRRHLPQIVPQTKKISVGSSQKKSIFAPLSFTLERNLSKTAREIPLDKSKTQCAQAQSQSKD